MPSILAIIALIVGTLLGLQLPDTDQVFTLVGLVHRSIMGFNPARPEKL